MAEIMWEATNALQVVSRSRSDMNIMASPRRLVAVFNLEIIKVLSTKCKMWPKKIRSCSDIRYLGKTPYGTISSSAL